MGELDGNFKLLGSVNLNPHIYIYIYNVGGRDAPVEDLTLGRLELAFIWVALCWRKVAPMGVIICTGSDAGKSSKP